MIRICAVCGSTKTGNEAEIKPGVVAHEQFWSKMHLPYCTYVLLNEHEKFQYFAEHGSPLSSEVED